MINEFVEKILVHEGEKINGKREQEVEIFLNFIGKFEVPAAEPTAEEIAAEEKLERQRERKRQSTRRYLEKKKREMEQEEIAARKKTA